MRPWSLVHFDEGLTGEGQGGKRALVVDGRVVPRDRSVRLQASHAQPHVPELRAALVRLDDQRAAALGGGTTATAGFCPDVPRGTLAFQATFPS